MNNSVLCEMAKKYEDRGNIEKAYQCYLEAALSEDDGEAMYALAQMYFDGEYVNESYEKAGKYFGRLYDEGLAVGQGRERAIELYKKAVECGLGYEEEYGKDEDCAKARERLRELGVA